MAYCGSSASFITCAHTPHHLRMWQCAPRPMCTSTATSHGTINDGWSQRGLCGLCPTLVTCVLALDTSNHATSVLTQHIAATKPPLQMACALFCLWQRRPQTICKLWQCLLDATQPFPHQPCQGTCFFAAPAADMTSQKHCNIVTFHQQLAILHTRFSTKPRPAPSVETSIVWGPGLLLQCGLAA